MSNQKHKKDELRVEIMAILGERLYEDANATKIQYYYRMYRCRVRYKKLVLDILEDRLRSVSATKIIYAYRGYKNRHKKKDNSCVKGEQKSDEKSHIRWSSESRVEREQQRADSVRARSPRSKSPRSKSPRTRSVQAKSPRARSVQARSARAKSPMDYLVDGLSNMSF